jgi:RimJ/RimL family protein N-acetyltransferase
MLIKTDLCGLRPWRTGDENSLAQHANNFKIWLNVRDIFPHPYTLADAHAWIQKANTLQNCLNLAIEADGAAIGGVGLILKEDVYRRSAEVGYWLGEDYWNKGIATAAVRSLAAYVFKNYDICRLFAGVYAYNKASMRVLEKAGFALEAIHRQAVIKNGQMVDEYLYVLLQ